MKRWFVSALAEFVLKYLMHCGERWSRGRAPDYQSRGRWFNLTYRHFETRSPYICLCALEETLKASGPFYLVSMPGEVKDPTQGVNV